MNLYLLKRADDEVHYGTCMGFVVAANDAFEARQIAMKDALDWGWVDKDDLWTNPKYSTCSVIEPGTEPRLILHDGNTG